ncbi:SRPBCC family protein [Flavobacterium sp.]|uniref:SRPBCC family protein n=1 Tax=Flavobacterium sp. TaxID=239 RepID=UPI003D136D78
MKRILLAVIVAPVIVSFNNTTSIKPEHENSINTKTKNNMKESKDYTSTILVEQNPVTVFNAIKNFRAWWSEEIEGNTDKLNETFFYHYQDVHLSKIKLIEIVPNKKLVYEVLDNEFNFVKDKREWIGTKLIFDISNENGKTKMQFTHEGLVPEHECYSVCQDAWTSYIQGSLKSLITTGKGKPNAKAGGLNAELVEKWGLPKK